MCSILGPTSHNALSRFEPVHLASSPRRHPGSARRRLWPSAHQPSSCLFSGPASRPSSSKPRGGPSSSRPDRTALPPPTTRPFLLHLPSQTLRLLKPLHETLSLPILSAAHLVSNPRSACMFEMRLSSASQRSSVTAQSGSSSPLAAQHRAGPASPTSGESIGTSYLVVAAGRTPAWGGRVRK